MYQLLDKKYVKKPHRKIFLNRRPKFQRRLANNEQVEMLLHAHGFETIYAEDLTFEEQIKVFNDAKYIVAIHGGGVTNVLFSNIAHVHLFEIFSEDLIHPHYYWFLEAIGIGYYDAIAGSRLDVNYNFSIDFPTFKSGIEKMLTRV